MFVDCAGIQNAQPVFHETIVLGLPSWHECYHVGQHAHPTDPLVSPLRQGPNVPDRQAAYPPGMAHNNAQYAIKANRDAAPTTLAIGSGCPTPTTLLGSPAQIHLAHGGAGHDLSFSVGSGKVDRRPRGQ
jgi:hypothetical protein